MLIQLIILLQLSSSPSFAGGVWDGIQGAYQWTTEEIKEIWRGWFGDDSEKILKELKKTVKDGDIIFIKSLSSQTKFLRLAMNSEWTHVGIVFIKQNGDDKGELVVWEAVQPVRETPLDEFIAASRSEDGSFVIKRLRNFSIYQKDRDKLIAALRPYLGKNYDLWFRWSDEEIYCSEFVYKGYKKAFGISIGKIERFYDYEDLESVLAEANQRYGNSPYQYNSNEPIVSPVSQFYDKDLRCIYQSHRGLCR